MTHRRRLIGAIVAPLLAVMFGVGAAQEGAPPMATEAPAAALKSVLLPPPTVAGSAEERVQAEPFAMSLRSSFASALSTLGFSAITVDASSEAPDAAQEASGPAPAEAEGGARSALWLARCSVSVAEGRLSYRLEVYGIVSGELVAADSFSTYAGPTAFPLIDDSASRAARQLSSFVDGSADRPRRPVPYRITIRSPDEGAAVSLGLPGAKSSVKAGVIKDGSLVLPYYPFTRGSTIQLYLSATGRRTQTLRVTLGEEAPIVEAPALEEQSFQDLLVGTGTGRLLGATAGYRRYIVPGWLFLFANDSVFAGYDFLPGSSPFLHEELWTGLGSFLIAPPESRFRFGAGVGLGYLLSCSTVAEAQRRLYFDLALLPVYLFSEYRIGRSTAIWLSINAAYSLDTGTSGILGNGWMNNGAPALYAGLVWRR